MDSLISFLIAFTAVASGLASVFAGAEASGFITAVLSHFDSLFTVAVVVGLAIQVLVPKVAHKPAVDVHHSLVPAQASHQMKQ